MSDYYAILNLSPGAGEAEIRQAVHRELRLWSSRTNAPQMERRQEAERRLKLVEEAERVLLVPEGRRSEGPSSSRTPVNMPPLPPRPETTRPPNKPARPKIPGGVAFASIVGVICIAAIALLPLIESLRRNYKSHKQFERTAAEWLAAHPGETPDLPERDTFDADGYTFHRNADGRFELWRHEKPVDTDPALPATESPPDNSQRGVTLANTIDTLPKQPVADAYPPPGFAKEKDGDFDAPNKDFRVEQWRNENASDNLVYQTWLVPQTGKPVRLPEARPLVEDADGQDSGSISYRSYFEFSPDAKYLLRSQKLCAGESETYLYQRVAGLEYKVLEADLQSRASAFFARLNGLELQEGINPVGVRLVSESGDNPVLALSGHLEGMEQDFGGWRCVFSPGDLTFSVPDEWLAANDAVLNKGIPTAPPDAQQTNGEQSDSPERAKATPAPQTPGGNNVDYIGYVNSRHGFSVMVPAILASNLREEPSGDEASATSSDGRTKFLLRVKRGVGTLKSLYKQCTAEHTAKDPGKVVDYKTLRNNWFVVSGFDGPRVYYVKVVARGSEALFMCLEYDRVGGNITPDMLTTMSRSFTGGVDASFEHPMPVQQPSEVLPPGATNSSTPQQTLSNGGGSDSYGNRDANAPGAVTASQPSAVLSRVYTVPELKKLIGSHPTGAGLRGDFVLVQRAGNQVLLQSRVEMRDWFPNVPANDPMFRGHTFVTVTCYKDISNFVKDQIVTIPAEQPLRIISVSKGGGTGISVQASF